MAYAARDLTENRGLGALSAERLVDVGERTLVAAERLVATWTEVEPLVRLLVGRMRAYVEGPDGPHGKEAAAILREAATVVSRVGGAAANVMRASEGQVRLALLVRGPQIEAREPGKLTEKQLVGVVLETARRIKAEHGACPVCTTTVAAG